MCCSLRTLCRCNLSPNLQLRLRDPVDGQVTMLECAYDQVEAQILAQMAQHSNDGSRSSSNTSSHDEDTLAAAAAQLRSNTNSSSIDDLVANVLRSGSASSSSSGRNHSLQEALAGTDLDPMDWLERFKGLNEAEALQELAVMKYLGGQAGVLRPKSSSGFGYGGGSAVAASGGSKKSKKRAMRANAKRS